MYLQQINKNKKKKKKSKEVNDMFSSDSDDDGKSRRNVNKQVDHIVHGITYCVVTLIYFEFGFSWQFLHVSLRKFLNYSSNGNE